MSTGVKHLSSAGFQKARDKPGEVKHGADTPRMVSAGHGEASLRYKTVSQLSLMFSLNCVLWLFLLKVMRW